MGRNSIGFVRLHLYGFVLAIVGSMNTPSALAAGANWDVATLAKLRAQHGLHSLERHLFLGKAVPKLMSREAIARVHMEKAKKDQTELGPEELERKVQATVEYQQRALARAAEGTLANLFVERLDDSGGLTLDGKGARVVLANILGEHDKELAELVDHGRIFWSVLPRPDGAAEPVLILPRHEIAAFGKPTSAFFILERGDSFQVTEGKIDSNELMKLDSVE